MYRNGVSKSSRRAFDRGILGARQSPYKTVWKKKKKQIFLRDIFNYGNLTVYENKKKILTRNLPTARTCIYRTDFIRSVNGLIKKKKKYRN